VVWGGGRGGGQLYIYICIYIFWQLYIYIYFFIFFIIIFNLSNLLLLHIIRNWSSPVRRWTPTANLNAWTPTATAGPGVVAVMCAAGGQQCGLTFLCVRMYVKIRRHQHTRVHAHFTFTKTIVRERSRLCFYCTIRLFFFLFFFLNSKSIILFT